MHDIQYVGNVYNFNEPSEEDIMWCCDPFMEQLNNIEASDDIRK